MILRSFVRLKMLLIQIFKQLNLVLFQTIESFTISSNLIDLQDGWCLNLRKLINVIVSKDNPKYSIYDDKKIIGKSLLKADNCDSVVFCYRKVEHVTIPAFIKHLESYSFQYCNQICQFEFTNDSELQTIGKQTFSDSSIEKFSIPLHLKTIGEYAFEDCENLRKIDIHPDSELQTIGRHAFRYTLIRSLWVPTQISRIEEGAFSRCRNLQLLFGN